MAKPLANSTDLGTSATPRLASGAQLWRLNKLGLLGEALETEGRVSAELASELLWDAAVRGLWEPSQRRYTPAGLKGLPIHERLRLERARRVRTRTAGDVHPHE
jgi:hypothetical protein